MCAFNIFHSVASTLDFFHLGIVYMAHFMENIVHKTELAKAVLIVKNSYRWAYFLSLKILTSFFKLNKHEN